MAVTSEKLDVARQEFKAQPNNITAACYLSMLSEAEEIGSIDDDEFHNGLADIEHYLWKGGSVVT